MPCGTLTGVVSSKHCFMMAPLVLEKDAGPLTPKSSWADDTSLDSSGHTKSLTFVGQCKSSATVERAWEAVLNSIPAHELSSVSAL